MRILVADDYAENLYLLETILTDLGYTVTAVGNGAQALAAARKDPPGMIITDILMPVMDGFELCRRWRKDKRLRDIPLVFYTATYTRSTDEEFALGLGADRFVIKPKDPKDLKEIIAQVLKEVSQGKKSVSKKPLGDEMEVLRQYNKVLFRKLEKKVADLEKAIQESRKTEAALRMSEERYRAIVENVNDALHIVDLKGDIIDVNGNACQQLGYTRKELIGHNLKAIDTEESARLIAERMRQIKAKKQLVFESVERRKDGNLLPVEVSAKLVSAEGDGLVHAFVRDITHRKKAERELNKAYRKASETLEGTVKAISTILDKRDPYTAGHEKRVTELAVAIAEEMKLSREEIDELRISSTLHDIGKTSVPVEILSKPGRLTDVEFDLIKTHSRAGYDIVKESAMPCNVSKTVLQHHERLDGSGYPGGIKKGNICRDACILAVADVIEAMSSHRPYRPALGIDAALDEVKKNKGKLYDPKVVDACNRLFKEKDFKFKA